LIKLSLLTGVPLFNSFVRGEPLNSALQNLVSKAKLETSLYLAVHNMILNRLGANHQLDRRTDRRTEGRKDGQNYDAR